MAQNFEFGLDTFGDVTIASSGKLLTHAQVIRDVVDEGVLADELGIDAFGVGEHHRPDFSVSAPKWYWRRSPDVPSASGSVRR
jgi:alkanesulfonate monooxygenase SsuD/methylene tetrahydromethanopterin reductase-like flavin-dependent oxidoreductase (luciferase family)